MEGAQRGTPSHMRCDAQRMGKRNNQLTFRRENGVYSVFSALNLQLGIKSQEKEKENQLRFTTI